MAVWAQKPLALVRMLVCPPSIYIYITLYPLKFDREQRYCRWDRNIRCGESIAGNPRVKSRRQHGAGKSVDVNSLHPGAKFKDYLAFFIAIDWIMLDIWMLKIDFFAFFSTWLWCFAHQSARLAQLRMLHPGLGCVLTADAAY